jgi:hypothetical protein
MNKRIAITILFVAIYITGISQTLKCVDPSRIAFTARINSIKNMDQGIYLSVETTIMNNSSDTLRYLSMSCSWANYYTINERAIHLPTPQCNEDTALLIQVAPHSNKKATLRLIALMSTKQLHNIEFKIGFKFLQACDTNKASRELRRSKNVIWSNSLTIK